VKFVALPNHLKKDLENVPPRLVYRHEMLQGIEEPLPPLKGFVMTTVKEKSAGRSPDAFPRPGGNRKRDDPGQLDVRSGAVRRLHHRRRPKLGQGLGGLERLRQILQPDDSLVDASAGGSRQFQRRNQHERRQGPDHRHGDG